MLQQYSNQKESYWPLNCLLFGGLSLVFLLSSFSLFAISEEIDEVNYKEANLLLEQANQLQRKAEQRSININEYRQLVSRLKVKIRKEKQPEVRANLTKEVAATNELIKSQRIEREMFLRKQKLTMNESLKLFEQAMIERRGDWVLNRKPLTMDRETLDFISRHAVTSSTDPDALTQETVNGEPSAKMTLKVAALVGQAAPVDLNISAFQLSSGQQLFAHIEVHNADLNRNNISQIPLNKIHQWRLVISDINGQPITGANIDIIGHMPGHVHGLPTQPQVTGEIDKGIYLVEGVKFQMQGWWVITFEVSTSGQQESEPDTLTFNLIL